MPATLRSHRRVERPVPVVAPADPRWPLLDLLRQCRKSLGLKDRDIAILRGLLSLLPAGFTDRHLVVFASNRVLCARCDGVEERTLRRHLVHLERLGLIQRRLSPNGKRFQLRDGGQTLLTYGIDLQPLFLKEADLRSMAEESRRAELRIKSLRQRIRDVLFHHPDLPGSAEARLCLRRVADEAQLEAIFSALEVNIPVAVPDEMPVDDGQFVRHIQSQTPESYEETAEMDLQHCLDQAKTAREILPKQPRNWREMLAVALELAPALGLGGRVVQSALNKLGNQRFALAILGMIEAFGRIRSPEAYLTHLASKAADGQLDAGRMFRSMTGVYTGVTG